VPTPTVDLAVLVTPPQGGIVEINPYTISDKDSKCN